MRVNAYASVTLLSIRAHGPEVGPWHVQAHWNAIGAEDLPPGVDHAATGFSLLFGVNAARRIAKIMPLMSPLHTIFRITREQLAPWNLARRVVVKEWQSAASSIIETEVESMRLLLHTRPDEKYAEWVRGEIVRCQRIILGMRAVTLAYALSTVLFVFVFIPPADRVLAYVAAIGLTWATRAAVGLAASVWRQRILALQNFLRETTRGE